MLDNFIKAEITETNTPGHNDMYQAIREFVQSHEIRCGEFEGHCYIINKINRNTFILFQEYDTPEEIFHTDEAILVDKTTLLNSIDKAALDKGIHIPKDTP